MNKRCGAVMMNISQIELEIYLNTIVMPELISKPVNVHPMLKARCLNLIYIFKKKIPDWEVGSYIQMIIPYLSSYSTVN
jgi:hypothetical protein